MSEAVPSSSSGRPMTSIETTIQQRRTSIQEGEHENCKRSLTSLALPWSLMILVSIVAAAALYPRGENYDDSDHSTGKDLSYLLSISSSSTERFLDGEMHREHVHKHVFEEAHKPLLPLDTSDQIGLVLTIGGLMIAAGGGIGGGGILVPIYILVMGFSPKHAIPLSNITVLGGALANMWLNLNKRHPMADRPLVDWDLIMVMEPLTIAGALLGAFLNKILPELFLTVMLVLLLSVTAYTTLKQAIKMYKAETRKLRELGFKADGTKESELTKIEIQDSTQNTSQAAEELLKHMDLQDGESPGSDTEETAQWKINQKLKQELDQILEEERVVPPQNITILVVMFIVVIAMNILKGGGAFRSPLGIECGSTGFWFATCLMLGWIVAVSAYVRTFLIKKWEKKRRVGYKYLEGDIEWDATATIKYPVICTAAGFFAGMFGVGGGIVKGPLMLAMGVHPAVASASSACMILFTSFAATTSFVIFGLLDMEYALVCFIVGFISTFFGQISLAILMKRAQRNSFIAFSIGGVVLLSALLMTVQSLLSMAEGEHHSSGGICGKDS